MPRRMFLLTLVVCLLFTLPTYAQEVLSGEITAESPTADFEVDLNAGDSVIVITQAVDSLDPMLLLYDPEGRMEAISEGLGDGNGVAFIMQEVESSGTYRVRVRGYGATIGEFQIAVESVVDAEAALIGGVTPFSDVQQTRTEDGAFVLGDPDAPITIVEFADWVCPHCLTYHPIIDQVILDYVITGQAKFEFRLLPTAGGQLTAFAGAVAECAELAQEGGFWEAYGLLYGYAESGQYNNLMPYRVIQALSLNLNDVETCLPTVTQWRTDMALAQSSGVNGTPAVMIRYGDSEMEWITHEGTTYNQGAPSFEIISAVIEAAQP